VTCVRFSILSVRLTLTSKQLHKLQPQVEVLVDPHVLELFRLHRFSLLFLMFFLPVGLYVTVIIVSIRGCHYIPNFFYRVLASRPGLNLDGPDLNTYSRSFKMSVLYGFADHKVAFHINWRRLCQRELLFPFDFMSPESHRAAFDKLMTTH
jgi:hypothetical protein